MLYEHFQFMLAASRGDHVQAYAHQERACGCFHLAFEKDTAWSLPALHTLDLSLRRVAMRADAQLKAEEKKPDKLGEAAGMLQKSFRITATDRAPLESSKKWGSLHVINNLFKIYFQLNNLRLCQILIRTVEGPGFPKALDGQTLSGRKFPTAQLVTYHYFVGTRFPSIVSAPCALHGLNQTHACSATRLERVHARSASGLATHAVDCMRASAHKAHPRNASVQSSCAGRLSLLNSQFAQAERQLTFSFTRCPSAAFKNKRLILRYLVPTRLVLGVFPSRELLQRYRLTYFMPLCRAVDRGDLRLFERELDAHQQLFIRHGSYLLIERSKTIAYRNFFRRVHTLHPPGTAKLDVPVFKRCLDAAGVVMDTDEIECVLANLIYKGYIKGYISHQHGKLVVSKGNPFPALREVLGAE